ncbi:hypothetical protein NL676_038032 [Syzygium grande]|nr:hypothetical protein NL676_038032 [Syzygium grande]
MGKGPSHCPKSKSHEAFERESGFDTSLQAPLKLREAEPPPPPPPPPLATTRPRPPAHSVCSLSASWIRLGSGGRISPASGCAGSRAATPAGSWPQFSRVCGHRFNGAVVHEMLTFVVNS